MDLLGERPHAIWERTAAQATGKRDQKRIEDCPTHWGISAASRRIIFLSGDIFDPVQPIFNLPVATGQF